MKKFEPERITYQNLETKVFKEPIPLMIVKPLKEDKNTCVFIFNPGLGATNTLSGYMNSFAFDNNYFVTYEKMAHGGNKNKPSQFKKPFLKELDCVVTWVMNNYPDKRIYLLGESWGCAINLLYLKKYRNKISGVINWNMPTQIKPPKNLKFKAGFVSGCKEVVTFLTNIELRLPLNESMHENLTRDGILLRAISMFPEARRSSRLAIAVWRYMLPSYRFLLKYSKDPNYNFIYIQSGQDALMTKRHIDKVRARADAKHYWEIPTGYHILSMEQEESVKLYNKILEFVGQKKELN